jgi:hypothetical protein
MKVVDKAIEQATERALVKTKQQLKDDIAALKKKIEEDPITWIVVGSTAVVAVAKLVDSLSAAQGRRAYAKQVKYSTRRRYPYGH